MAQPCPIGLMPITASFNACRRPSQARTPAPVPFGAYSIWASPNVGAIYGLRLDTGGQTRVDGQGVWPGVALYGTRWNQFHDGERGRSLRQRRRFRSSLFQRRCAPVQRLRQLRDAKQLLGDGLLQWSHMFEIRLQCFKSPNCHSDWSYAWTTSFTTAVHDSSPPTIAAAGSLLSGAVMHGVQSLDTTATDAGGGARSVRVSVNGIHSRSVDFCPPSYGGRYTALKPCPSYRASSSRSTPRGIPVGRTDRMTLWSVRRMRVAISPICVRRVVNVDNSCPGSGGTAAADLDGGADVGGQLKDRAASPRMSSR